MREVKRIFLPRERARLLGDRPTSMILIRRVIAQRVSVSRHHTAAEAYVTCYRAVAFSMPIYQARATFRAAMPP